ncbi:hypothetical protein DH2020_046655 [Rehmannia glutinosa]|uniref:Uncharacterized protein n=1 Tax=Rehmannia glutinosa TaxID=99300 RepID=A0ABR0UAR1_REHGL
MSCEIQIQKTGLCLNDVGLFPDKAQKNTHNVVLLIVNRTNQETTQSGAEPRQLKFIPQRTKFSYEFVNPLMLKWGNVGTSNTAEEVALFILLYMAQFAADFGNHSCTCRGLGLSGIYLGKNGEACDDMAFRISKHRSDSHSGLGIIDASVFNFIHPIVGLVHRKFGSGLWWGSLGYICRDDEGGVSLIELIRSISKYLSCCLKIHLLSKRNPILAQLSSLIGDSWPQYPPRDDGLPLGSRAHGPPAPSAQIVIAMIVYDFTLRGIKELGQSGGLPSFNLNYRIDDTDDETQQANEPLPMENVCRGRGRRQHQRRDCGTKNAKQQSFLLPAEGLKDITKHECIKIKDNFAMVIQRCSDFNVTSDKLYRAHIETRSYKR